MDEQAITKPPGSRPKPAPEPTTKAGRAALRALLKQRSVLASLEALHAEMGDVFRIPLPGFDPVVLVGPSANRFVAVTGREDLNWRPEGDPVTRLLRQGLLVVDGPQHDQLRRTLLPALQKQRLSGYIDGMRLRTDQVSAAWEEAATVDMLVEMRKIALLIFFETLYGTDFTPDLDRMWNPILRLLRYISPGLWVVFPGLPRFGYRQAIQEMDAYLYGLIASRRQNPKEGQDLLNLLIAAGLEDGLIRDQLLTMLIAGHDTSTAALAWSLYLLGKHPQAMRRAQEEVDEVLGHSPPADESVQNLRYLEWVMLEALRLYPPIHIGNRSVARDIEFEGYRIPAGTRVVYSIYLSHRHPDYWQQPAEFDPERFNRVRSADRAHYSYVPFGGGPRNCIGLAFAQVEILVVLARLLQQFDLELESKHVHPHMGATLEPRPAVRMRVRRRASPIR